MAAFGIPAEIGRLRKVLVHRPGASLERVTSGNLKALGFTNVLWAERAREEHDTFTNLLREQGVEIAYFDRLLDQTMHFPDARDWLLDRRMQARRLGPELNLDTREWLDSLNDQSLAEILIAGVTLEELPFKPPGVVTSLMEQRDFILPPLPNQMFMRDTSTWVGGGVTLNPMAATVRKGESDNVAAVYHFHPSFDVAAFGVWWGLDDHLQGNLSLAGGDILLAGNRRVVIAAGRQTTPQAVAELSAALIDRAGMEEILVLKMPAGEQDLRLDQVFTLCREDLALVRKPVTTGIASFSIRAAREPGRLIVERQRRNFVEVMRRTLGLKKLHTISLDGPGDEDGRWDTASGVLTIKPGTVISYERNTRTNELLRDAGINVLSAPASELSRSGGGPQRLVCPLSRDDPAG